MIKQLDLTKDMRLVAGMIYPGKYLGKPVPFDQLPTRVRFRYRAHAGRIIFMLLASGWWRDDN